MNSKSGANLRLITVIRILRLSGFEVEVFTGKTFRFIDGAKKFDFGVLVSFAQLRNYFNLKSVTSNIWLDSTDSLIKTRLLGLGRFRIFSYFLGMLEIFLALVLEKKFLCVTYISEKDMKFDSLLFRDSQKFIFPNSSINRMVSKNSSSDIQIYFVGDISYNANRKAIKFIEKSMKRTPLRCKNGITIVSNRTNCLKQKFFRNGNKLVYRQDIATDELYMENTIHIIPIWNSVGIKNKVVEPASIGLRVLAGTPSFNGLIFHQHMIPVKKKSDFFPTLNKLLDEKFRLQHLNYSVVETDQTSEMIDFLKRNFKNDLRNE